MYSLKTIKFVLESDIIEMIMGIIFSIMGDFLALLKSIMGKNLSIIGWGLVRGEGWWQRYPVSDEIPRGTLQF